ncbi:MAG: Ig-like domain-containing protein, partial [Streptomycetales bacterium]
DAVEGELSSDRARWTAAQSLTLDTNYTVHVTAVDEHGLSKATQTAFSTIEPAATLETYVAPLEAQTVGVGMPLLVTLSESVDNRAAVERALQVEAKPATEGGWYWLDDRTLRYRPKKYWEPGTDVTLHVRLTGVDAGGGVWGAETRDIAFDIGDSMVSIVDDSTQMMKVYRNGDHIRTIPISDGKDGFRTRGGVKVIMSQHRSYDMNSASIGIDPSSAEGYDLSDVPYAMRVTGSGEFLHAAPWRESAGVFGVERSSHGCIGMTTADAAWLYGQSRPGDVVKVLHSPEPPPPVWNGYSGWNLSWHEWQKGSAFH